MATKRVDIFELPAGDSAMVYPGTVYVNRGDSIDFYNKTRPNATLLVTEVVLDGVVPYEVVGISTGGPHTYTVAQVAADGSHEYQVLVTLKNGAKVWAVGSSTPRIIIRPTSEIS
ncbi:MAG: hypothetical protein C3F15_05230 [Holophagae bacterium]|nr:MAG: hypothetical protein C3F15_05230 [Holophagae bacterium]